MIHRRPPTALVAMSGGVDSTVAAALLHERGYEVIGATLKLWCYEEREPGPRACCSLDAIRDARSAAARLGFHHQVLDYSALFEERVARPFVAEYLAGRTPYPCTACNADLKFGRLWEHARAAGAGHLATGHYVRLGTARLPDGGEEPALHRAAHRAKDQSYALWALDRAVLPHLLFPLGELGKERIREEARRLGVGHVAEKIESQDLCFVGGNGRYGAYLTERAGAERVDRPGPIVDAEGRHRGTHRGLAHYTVGQRRGLGLSDREPLYVTALDPGENTLRVGRAPSLLAREAVTGPANWLSRVPPVAGARIDAQIRYRHAPAPARLWPREGRVPEGETFDPAAGVRLRFDEPQRAITPGQSAVFYAGDRLLGGAPLIRPGGESRTGVTR